MLNRKSNVGPGLEWQLALLGSQRSFFCFLGCTRPPLDGAGAPSSAPARPAWLLWLPGCCRRLGGGAGTKEAAGRGDPSAHRDPCNTGLWIPVDGIPEPSGWEEMGRGWGLCSALSPCQRPLGQQVPISTSGCCSRTHPFHTGLWRGPCSRKPKFHLGFDTA